MKTIFKILSGRGTIVSQSPYLHKESILNVTAATSGQVSKPCFNRVILGMKLSHHIHLHLTFNGRLHFTT
jgi:hypothetical protein